MSNKKLSKCCKAEMLVATADEGTSFSVCSACKNACNPISKINKKNRKDYLMSKEKQSEWEKRFVQEFGIHFSKSEFQFVLEFIKEEIQKSKEETLKEAIAYLIKKNPVRVPSSVMVDYSEAIADLEKLNKKWSIRL